MKNKVHLIDCMEFMAGLPDNHYDLAIVDPPYGSGGSFFSGGRTETGSSKLYNGWDTRPDEKYFSELIRVSKNNIIWGANYFGIGSCRGFIVWDKKQPVKNYSRCELAYTTFDVPSKIFEYGYTNVINYEPRIHPTQKPVALYKWILQNYAKPGNTIFDSHVGSGSIRIACHDLGFDFEGCEIDADYWQAQENRFVDYISKTNSSSLPEELEKGLNNF